MDVLKVGFELGVELRGGGEGGPEDWEVVGEEGE